MRHAREMHSMRWTPVRYTSMRCTPARYPPMRYTLVRCTRVKMCARGSVAFLGGILATPSCSLNNFTRLLPRENNLSGDSVT
jgi:hypothetical protein